MSHLLANVHSPVVCLAQSWDRNGAMSSKSDYIAAVCHMRDDELVPYDDSYSFNAADDKEAARIALEWVTSSISLIVEPTWLQVINKDGKSIYSHKLGDL
jgi:hypothetical protein